MYQRIKIPCLLSSLTRAMYMVVVSFSVDLAVRVFSRLFLLSR